MTTRFFVAIVALLTVFVFCGSSFEADAARFGGGRSFGGSSTFSRPFSSSRVPQGSVQNPQATRQQQPGAATAPVAGRFGGMGGIFGGLLAGTLIGSLLSGHGFAGGGMLDMLLLGLGVYLLFKFLGRRRTVQQGGTNSSGLSMPIPDGNTTSRNTQFSGQDRGLWGVLGGQGGGTTAGGVPVYSADVPTGFDQEDFLRGAKILYQRMNDSWDRRDLDDIAEFSTQPFMTEIRRQAEGSPHPEKTEIMLINASLVSVLTEAGRETAAVYFNVMLREDPSQSASVQVREVWHFVRATGSRDMWKLDGIQQVEEY